MNISLFITLLTAFSTVTSVITEGVKGLLSKKSVIYSSNVLVFVIACVVGIGGTGVYYILSSIDFSLINITCMILMGLATSIGAMVGYDKVIQTINQLKTLKVN